MSPLLPAASFLTGAAGLAFELLWAKRLGLVLGGAATAQAAVLAAFLGGLALGAARLGPAADAAPEPRRFFARLEWAVAALGLLAPLLLRLTDGPLRWAGPLLVLGHAFLMGGALPALARAAGGSARRSVGLLYAANTAGAALGCLATPFLLIPALGLDWAFAAAAALNVIASFAALSAAATVEPAPALATPASREAAPPSFQLVLAAVFASGAAALVYEVAWTRLLSLVLGSSVYSFAEMLAALIAGLSVGGALAARGARRGRDPLLLLGLAAGATALAVLAGLPLATRLPYVFLRLRMAVGPELPFLAFEALKFGACALLLLVPAAALGMTLPLAADAAGGEGGRGGRVGAVLAANALGNALGAGLGLFLLPRLGVEGSLRAAAAAHLLVGGALLWRAAPRARAATATGLLAALALCALAPRWDHRLLARGTYRNRGEGWSSWARFKEYHAKPELLFHRDDREATVDVLLFEREHLSLHVNGKPEASTSSDMETQVLLGSLPLLLKPEARSMLVIGWGSGISVGSALKHPLPRLDAVELIPAVVEGSKGFHEHNGRPEQDPRLGLALEDAKTFLARPGPGYDVIASEPSNPWMAGVADLFTLEFYARARRRLAPGGLFVQWFHLYEMDDESFALVLRTFRSVFPRVTIWRSKTAPDAMLIGSDLALEPDPEALERAFLRPEVWQDLGRAGIGTATSVLSLQSASEETVARLAGEGPLNSELRPILEHRAPRAYYRGKKSDILDRHDDRGDPARRGELLLARHLRLRGKPLRPLELLDWASLHHLPAAEAEVELTIAEWRRLYPRDPRAAEARRVIRASWGLGD